MFDLFPGLIIGVVISMAAFLIFITGANMAKDGVSEQCVKLSGFSYKDKVYECKVKP